MRRSILVLFTVVALSTASAAVRPATFSDDDEDDAVILKFKTMAAVTGPYVGPANPIRGVPGGGLPWIIDRGRGELKASGELKVHVRGLVLPSPPFNFTNPLPNFRAVVSCQCIDENGGATVVNITTDAFPATLEGDSNIETQVTLPQPCIAPIVFVVHPTGGRWFAATGS